MLKIFKNHTTKTSLLDDFMYYENRQRIMQDEKTRLLIKSYESPFFVPPLDPPRKLNFVIDLPPSEEKMTKQTDVRSLEKPLATSTATDQVSLKSDDINRSSMNEKCSTAETKDDIVSTLKIGSLTINPKQVESIPTMAAAPPTPAGTVVGTESVDVVTVGSMPVKVNGLLSLLVCSPLGLFHLILEHCSLKRESSLVKMGPHVNEAGILPLI